MLLPETYRKPMKDLWKINYSKSKKIPVKICLDWSLTYAILPIFIKYKIQVYEYDSRINQPKDADIALIYPITGPKLDFNPNTQYFFFRFTTASDHLINEYISKEKDLFYYHRQYEQMENVYWISDEWLDKKFNISGRMTKSLYQSCFWELDFLWEKNKTSRYPNQKRQGWTWYIMKSRLMRDLCAKWLYHNPRIFDFPHQFVYDQCPEEYLDQLQSKMFRPINRSDQKNWRQKQMGKNYVSEHEHEGIITRVENDYKRFAIDIVTETEDAYGFGWQDKLIKPMVAHKPFIILGCQHWLKTWKRIGFQSFHPIIDESYDNEPDHETRVNKAMSSMLKALESNSLQINYQKIDAICEHNAKQYKKIVQSGYREELFVVRALKTFANLDITNLVDK